MVERWLTGGPIVDALTPAMREEIALALLLWKDFKCDGRFDPEVTLMALRFATMLDVLAEFNALLPQLPPMRIVPR
jgi:hypothetical protein